VVDKVALGQVYSQYFCFSCQFSFHRLFHTHHHHHQSIGVGKKGQIVVEVPSGLSLTQPQWKKKKLKYFAFHCATVYTPNWPWRFWHVVLRQALAVEGLHSILSVLMALLPALDINNHYNDRSVIILCSKISGDCWYRTRDFLNNKILWSTIREPFVGRPGGLAVNVPTYYSPPSQFNSYHRHHLTI
jgi:hypothetical protein